MRAQSSGVAGGVIIAISTFYAAAASNKTPPLSAGASCSPFWRLAPVAQEAQQEQEQVDKIEVERQRPHHRLAADEGTAVRGRVHLLDPLRIPRRQAGEDEDADRRNRELQPRALDEHVHQRSEDQPESATDHEGADGREIALRGVAVEA